MTSPLFFLLFCLNISLCLQSLCTENSSACSTSDCIVGKSYKFPVIHSILTETSYRYSHTMLISLHPAVTCGRLSSSRYWINCFGALGSSNSCGSPLNSTNAFDQLLFCRILAEFNKYSCCMSVQYRYTDTLACDNRLCSRLRSHRLLLYPRFLMALSRSSLPRRRCMG